MTFTKEQLIARAKQRIASAEDCNGLMGPLAKMDVALIEMALAGMEAEPVGVTDKSEIECLKRGEMANVMPPDYKGCDSGDSVYLYAAPQPLTTSDRAELENCRNAQQVVPEWTNEQCLEFLSIAFRHAEIKGDLEMDDIRLGVKMVNSRRAAMLQVKAEPVSHEKTEIVKHWYMVSWIAREGRHGSTEVWFDHPWMIGDMLEVTKSIAELNNVTGLVIVSALPIAAGG